MGKLRALGKGRLVLLVPVFLAGCGASDVTWPGDPGPQVVPAGAEPQEGASIAGRFWVEIVPTAGLMAVYPIHSGNIIFRGERIEAASYDYGSPGGGAVRNTE